MSAMGRHQLPPPAAGWRQPRRRTSAGLAPARRPAHHRLHSKACISRSSGSLGASIASGPSPPAAQRLPTVGRASE